MVTRLGEEEGRLKEGMGSGFGWWRGLAGIRGGMSLGVGSWFEDNLWMVVGDDASIFFF